MVGPAESRVVWANRYAVFDEIASGGMATVYLAGRLGQVNGRRVVAVKELFEQYAKQPEFVAMFLDEARLAARVRHPNVITTYQILRVPDSLAIVMEFIVGVALVELLQVARERETRISNGIAGSIVAGTLRGLHAAHEACDETGQPFGLVHRDMSPHNVMVGKDGVPRVIDFGIAKAAGRIQSTEAGTLKGKFAYTAPEQIRGDEVDRRTDVYAVGVMLWEILTGRRLFKGSSNAMLLASRASGGMRAAAPSTLNASVTPQADALVLRALELDPRSRFDTAAEMAQAVEQALGVASLPDVAAWVDRLAHVAIKKVEAKYQAVEKAIKDGELEELTQVVRARPLASERQSRPSLLFEAPDLDLPAPSQRVARPSSPSVTPPRSSVMPPSSVLPPSSVVSPSSVAPPSSMLPHVVEARPAGRPGVRMVAIPFAAKAAANDPPVVAGLELQLDVPPVSRAPSRTAIPTRTVAPPPVFVPEPAPSERLSPARLLLNRLWAIGSDIDVFESSASRTVMMLVGGLLLLGGALAFEGSSLLESLAVRAAEQRGLALSASRVTVGGGGLTLHDASLTFARSSGVTLRAPEVHVSLDGWGSAERVAIAGYELRVTGPASDIAPRIHAWASTPHAPIELDASRGHLVWTDAVLPGVNLEGQDATLAIGMADGPDIRFATSALTVILPGGALGPWALSVDSALEDTKVGLVVDHAHPDAAPAVTLLVRPTLGRLFSVALPRTKLSELGIPPAILSASSDTELEIALEGQLFPTGEPVHVHARFGLFGATVPALADAAAVTDLVVEGEVGGPPSDPLDVHSGTLKIQDVTTSFKGRVLLDRRGVRLEIDRPAAKAPQPQLVAFDTRALTQTGP